MLNVTIDEIQRDPLKYLHQVEAGETLVILRAGKPIAELKPIASTKQLRPFGLCAGEFTVPDDFDDPLPEDILNASILTLNHQLLNLPNLIPVDSSDPDLLSF